MIEPQWWNGRYWTRDDEIRRVENTWTDLLNARPKDPDLTRVQIILLRVFQDHNLRVRVVSNGEWEGNRAAWMDALEWRFETTLIQWTTLKGPKATAVAKELVELAWKRIVEDNE